MRIKEPSHKPGKLENNNPRDPGPTPLHRNDGDRYHSTALTSKRQSACNRPRSSNSVDQHHLACRSQTPWRTLPTPVDPHLESLGRVPSEDLCNLNAEPSSFDLTVTNTHGLFSHMRAIDDGSKPEHVDIGRPEGQSSMAGVGKGAPFRRHHLTDGVPQRAIE